VFQVTTCSRARQALSAATRRIQPPFGWRQAVMTSSSAAAVLALPTASAPPAAAATAPTAARAASARIRLILMGLLPVE
jgi:hypothetical protein